MPDTLHGHESIESRLDRELNVRAIVGTGIAVVALMALAAVILWIGWGIASDRLAERDAAPPALPEARESMAPPEPRLEASPPASLRLYLEEQREVLESWGWVEEGEIARIPVDRAVALALEGEISLETVVARAPADEEVAE